jgi:hypothetical protein
MLDRQRLGSDDMGILQVDPPVASPKQQKPFKFHYYPMDDFRQPDRDWETETQTQVPQM